MNPRCVTNMATQLGPYLLEHRRAKHRITMLYKIINNLVNIPVHHQLKVHDSSTRGSASHKFIAVPVAMFQRERIKLVTPWNHKAGTMKAEECHP